MCMTKNDTKIISIVIHTDMCMTKTHKNIDSHSYKDVVDETNTKIIGIFIRTEMCMPKTQKNMDSHSFVHDENL